MRVKGGQAGRRSKLAVVLGGGGITGGVFEVGALRALDRALGGEVVTSADLYAGASAGALVAAMLAAGLTPADLDSVIVSGARNRRGLPALKRTSIYGVDAGAWLRTAGKLPWVMSTGFLQSLLPGESTRLADAFFEALGALPPGMFSNEPLARFVKQGLDALGLQDRFDALPRELLITAVNIDTGHRVVFGAPGTKATPISKAVQASAAVPLLFQPVRLDGQEFVDGGLERNLPVEPAIEAGAELVLAINPIVPVVNDPRGADSLGAGFRYLSQRGLPAVADQVFRMIVRSQVVEGLKSMRERYPEVDVVLIEPEAGDYLMFSKHLMRYSARAELAAHGFNSTRERLQRDSEALQRTFARHGLRFDPSRLGGAARPKRRPMAQELAQWAGMIPGLRGMARRPVGDLF